MSEACDWNKLTIPQLKEHLKKRGLDQAGKKADLVARLVASDQTVNQGEEKGEAGEKVQKAEGESKEVEPEDTAETKDTSLSADNQTGEMDFTENITFEELEGSSSQNTVTVFRSSAAESGEPEAAETAEPAKGGDGEGGEAEKKSDAKEGEAEGKEGEGQGEGDQATTEGTEEQKEPVEELPDVSSQFSIDIPRERDFFRLTWNGKKFTVPFRMEIASELLPTFKARSLIVHPVTVAELSTDLFKRLMEKAQKFSVDFFDRTTGKTESGQVKFLFGSATEVEEAITELKEFKESLVTDQMAFEFKDSDDDFIPIFKKEKSENSGSVVQRLLFVGNLPNDVTEATLSELFPGALRVILSPHKETEGNTENVETTRHAYIEYLSEDEVVAAAESHKDKTLNDEKLFVIRAIGVRKDRFGLLSDSLRQIFLDKIRKLQRILKNPYNKSQQDLNEIERTINQTKEKLATDTKHRLGWGMQLGRLDECVLDREDDPRNIDSLGSRGNQRGRGGRGGGFRGGQGMRRGGMNDQRGGYGYGGGMGGYGRGGWNSGYGGGYQSYYGGGGSGAYPTQSYGGGYNQFSGKRKGSFDNYSGDWKRGRGSYGQF